MAFKGIEDRFKSKAHGLYRRYSTKDGSDIHPLLEFKPDDPTARDTANDSRINPTGSLKRDKDRVGKWSKTGQGSIFMGNQKRLQDANKFSQTRRLNKEFITDNVDQTTHARRPENAPSMFAVSGDISNQSPGVDSKIGAAGRLQRETSNEAIRHLMGRGGRNNIFSYIPTPKIIKSIIKVYKLTEYGSLGIDQRPELDFDGSYYSIAIWNGFRKTNGFRDNLDAAAANLRIGNIDGAWKSLKQSGRDVLNQLKGAVPVEIRGLIPGINMIPDGRNSTNSGLDGRRYFITSKNDADRYLKNSVVFSSTSEGLDHTSARLSFLYRQPYVIAKSPVVPKTTSYFAKKFGAPSDGLRFSISKAMTSMKSFSNVDILRNAVDIIKLNSSFETKKSPNSAEEAMLFGELSLKSRYQDDERLTFIRKQLESQRLDQVEYWKVNKPELGYNDGEWYKPGQEILIDPQVRKFPKGGPGRYIDSMNTDGIDVRKVSKDGPTSQEVSDLQKAMGGKDLINVWFFDTSKSEMIPFRAYISDLNETITPEVQDTKYIGRLERNIVYLGAIREVSFGLMVYAMSPEELLKIWNKVDRLVGLCFPGGYSQGFMVPPFVKFTLGNMYYNQPCYIKSLTHNYENGVSWEIEEGSQVPHGLKMNITLSIIEKSQKRTGSNFYDFTEKNLPRITTGGE